MTQDQDQNIELRYIKRDLKSLQDQVTKGFGDLSFKIDNTTITRREFEDKIGIFKDEINSIRKILVFIGSGVALSIIGAFMKLVLNV